jgi:hypothetical protein
MIHFPCRYCRRSLDAEDRLIGAPVVCPGCKAYVSVPRPGGPEPPLIDVPEVRDVARAPKQFLVRLLLGCQILLVPLAFALLLGQPWLCYVTLTAALVLEVAGMVWLLLAAFSESVLQGLLVLLVPCYAFVYVVTHWDEADRPGLLLLAGVLAHLAAGFALAVVGS